jgi:hypothetical protein
MHFANYIVLGLLIAFTPRKKFAVAHSEAPSPVVG